MDIIDIQSELQEASQKPNNTIDTDIFQVLENLTKVQNEKAKRCENFKLQENIPS